jgi:hypothetical protein
VNPIKIVRAQSLAGRRDAPSYGRNTDSQRKRRFPIRVCVVRNATQPVNQQLRFVAVVDDKQIFGQQTRSKTNRAGSSMEIEFACEAGGITGLELQLRQFEFKSMGVITLPPEK